MNEQELRKHAKCSLCKRKILESGMPLFYRLTVERFGVKLDAVKRQAGLEALLNGHVRIAQVMGADEEMAMPIMDALTIVVCESCSTGERHCVAALAEHEGVQP